MDPRHEAATAAGRHEPVLLAEALEALAVKRGGLYADGTLGLGGHAEAVLEASAPDGRLLGADRDAESLERARQRLERFGARASFHHGDWRDVTSWLGEARPDGVLLDLGVSSAQLDDPDRGFSFQGEGPLDMRMDRSVGAPAAEAVNRLPEGELADLIFRFGEEPASRRIARAIVASRRRAPIRTTAELAAIVRGASSPSVRSWGRPRRRLGSWAARSRIDPATRTFQALRIHVNRELEGVQAALAELARRLAPGGRLVVIAFHSLEDREVKQAFRALAAEGFAVLTKKPLTPGEEEQRRNPRSRSARLRALARSQAA